MVKRLARFAVAIIGGGLLLSRGVFAAGLEIHADQTSVELGKPIWITLRSNQITYSLESLDFGPWLDRVAVSRDIELATDHEHHYQTVRLHVYPLRTGQLELPGLHFVQATSPALHIKVTPAIEPGSGLPMDFSCQLSTQQPWQRQQVIAQCRITLSNGYAVFRQASNNTPGVQLQPLPKQQSRVESKHNARMHYLLGWRVTASRAGALRVEFPPIEYLRDGVVVRRFYIAPRTLQVRALPAWLPGTIPVGRVTLTNYGLKHPWLESGVLSQLQLGLRLDGIDAGLAPDYAAQLRSNRLWRFYPAQSHSAAGKTTLQQHIEYSIPLLARGIGFRRLPALRVQYFDPVSGRLRAEQVRGPLLLVFNSWLLAGLALLILILFYVPARRLWRCLCRYWYRNRSYRQVLQQLATADSLAALRTAMQGMARAEGWRANLTHRAWQQRMLRVSTAAAQVPVTELDAACYAGADFDTRILAGSLTRICRHRQFALR